MGASQIPRLRVIAGPNGSGKSVLKEIITQKNLMGVYLNADEVQKQLISPTGINLSEFGCRLSGLEAKQKVLASSILQYPDRLEMASQIRCDGQVLRHGGDFSASYLASALVEVIRNDLIDQGSSFTLETVMSHQSKVDLLCEGRTKGFRTYLYYIATSKPEINIARVRARVALGGHDVPPDKIRARYFRSLSLLVSAIQCASRSFIFDNSGEGKAASWLAEFEDGERYSYKQELMPAWFMDSVDRFMNHETP